MENTVNITLRDPMHIRIESEDYDYLQELKEELTFFVDGYNWMPKYKSGFWDGRISLMKSGYCLPYGLLLEVLKINKKSFPQINTIVSDEVKELFKGPELEPLYDLNLFPYDYQVDCIEKALKYRRGIVRSTTASGKSLMISYIVKTILENKLSKQCLIIVPTISLIAQFIGDMEEYGINKNWTTGKVNAKHKEWDKDIVVATWQTLMKNHDKLKKYETVIFDETHQVKSHQLSSILKKSTKAKYRLGFTGTLHAGRLDNLNVFSYLGPVIAEYSSANLAKRGYISKCTVNIIDITYNEAFDGTYNEVKDMVFTNEYRLSVLKYIIENVDHNILLLVGKVEKEGEYLRDWLENKIDKKVIFLSGRDKVEVREEWRNKCKTRNDIVIIATYGIMSTGINIPSLKYTILAAPFKSKIRVLQSIGRNLRKHENKEESGATIFDIHDETLYFSLHGNIRSRFYSTEGFEIIETILDEGDELEFDV